MDEKSVPDDFSETMPFSALRDVGFLWLINRCVFHPRGFALAFDMEIETNDETGEETSVVVTGWRITGDGTEPWMFGESMAERENELFASVEAFLNARRPAAPVVVDEHADNPDWWGDVEHG